MPFSVLPFSKFHEIAGNSNQAQYLKDYLSAIRCQTIVVEEEYIDKDFLIDYSNYYSRSFLNVERFVSRIHFFSHIFSRNTFRNDLNKNTVTKYQKNYLGFCIIKPIKNTRNHFIIGRTALKTYPPIDDEKKCSRHYITIPCSANLFGIDLVVDSIPYQTQDSVVGACATIALWTALYPLNSLFQTPIKSPSEITKLASSFPTRSKRFPSSGLILEQMIHFLYSMDLDTDVITISHEIEYPKDGEFQVTWTTPDKNYEVFELAVMALENIKMPIIATLALKKQNHWDYHAAVITGYRRDENKNIVEFYLHDDQIGPYCRCKWVNRTIESDPEPGSEVSIPFEVRQIQNHWNTDRGYDELAIMHLLIPEYQKIRTPFTKITPAYDIINKMFSDHDNLHFKTELLLTNVQKYKKEILSLHNNYKAITKNLPKYFFIIRIYVNNHHSYDILYDATSHEMTDPIQLFDFT